MIRILTNSIIDSNDDSINSNTLLPVIVTVRNNYTQLQIMSKVFQFLI